MRWQKLCPATVACFLGSNINSEKHELQTDAGAITYEAVVAATHVPIQGERDTFGAALFLRLAAYSTYALEAEIESTAESLFWDTNDPYLYFRFDTRDLQELGNHWRRRSQDRPGRGNGITLRAAEKTLKKTFPTAKLNHR